MHLDLFNWHLTEWLKLQLRTILLSFWIIFNHTFISIIWSCDFNFFNLDNSTSQLLCVLWISFRLLRLFFHFEKIKLNLPVSFELLFACFISIQFCKSFFSLEHLWEGNHLFCLIIWNFPVHNHTSTSKDKHALHF